MNNEKTTTGRAGKPFGHVPGHQYHDIEATITQTTTGRWRVRILETWGSAQGTDEEHGRKYATGRAESLDEAIIDARRRADAAGIGPEYLDGAIDEAESAMIDFLSL